MHLSLTDKHDAAIARAESLHDKMQTAYHSDNDDIFALTSSNAELLTIINELATRLDKVSEYVKLKGGDNIG